MPYTITVSRKTRVGVVRLAGSVDGAEIVTAAADLAAHPRWKGGFRPVWDMTGVTRLDFSPDHMASMLAQEAHLDEIGATGDAIIITRDEVTAELVLIIRAHVAKVGRTVTSVQTVAEAEALLGVALPSE